MITTEQARNIASQWHSVMTWSDPGVCMYALSSTGKVQSRQHRADLVAYTKSCIPAAEPEDVQDLHQLLEFINHTPIRKDH